MKAKSQFKERSTATNVEIELPVPPDAITPEVKSSMGSASYAPEKEAMVWKIKSFPGGKVRAISCRKLGFLSFFAIGESSFFSWGSLFSGVYFEGQIWTAECGSRR